MNGATAPTMMMPDLPPLYIPSTPAAGSDGVAGKAASLLRGTPGMDVKVGSSSSSGRSSRRSANGAAAVVATTSWKGVLCGAVAMLVAVSIVGAGLLVSSRSAPVGHIAGVPMPVPGPGSVPGMLDGGKGHEVAAGAAAISAGAAAAARDQERDGLGPTAPGSVAASKVVFPSPPLGQPPVCRIIGGGPHLERCAPHIVIVGAMKCGTDEIAAWLTRHPNIVGSIHENHYFSLHWQEDLDPRDDPRFLEGLSNTRGSNTRVLSIARSPSSLLFPATAARYKKWFPNVKVIAAVCAPVARTLAQFNHYRQFPEGALLTVFPWLPAACR